MFFVFFVVNKYLPMKKHPHICRIQEATSLDSIIHQTGELLRQGGVIICATDTGYLLGVDGLNPGAIGKIYAIKDRSFDKPIHLVVADLTMAKALGEFTHCAERVFQHFLPGPLTLIVKRKPLVPDLLVSGLPGVGLRMPENAFLLRLVKETGIPLTATSANRSGQLTPYSMEQVLTELGDAVEFVDLMIDQGPTQHRQPSTILDMSLSLPKILREGPITAEMLAQAGVWS
jgi:L-threonylcarbamoyladenylate synthase